LPLEQKITILIQPKGAKSGAVRIAYSAKNKEKNTNHMERTSVILKPTKADGC
jgi:hypothetical protein